MTDDFMVESGMSKLSESLTNRLRAKVANEWWNATRYIGYAKGTDTWALHTSSTPSPLLNKEDDAETEAQLFALCNPDMKAALRKSLKDDLKYNEDYARTGYIGHVAGVPLRTSKLIPDGCVIIASKKAVKYFYKKDVEIERERDANTRTNKVYGRQVGLVAFVDEGECAIIAPNGTAPDHHHRLHRRRNGQGHHRRLRGRRARGGVAQRREDRRRRRDGHDLELHHRHRHRRREVQRAPVRPGFAAATSAEKTVTGK